MEWEQICEVCPLKNPKERDLIRRRFDRIARLETFIEHLARIVPLDWGRIAEELKNEISYEAIASGLNIVDKSTLVGPIDSKIHAEMKKEQDVRYNI